MKAKKTLYIGPFRVDRKNKKLIEKAAEIDSRSVSNFVRLAAIDKAIEVIRKDQKTRKRASDL